MSDPTHHEVTWGAVLRLNLRFAVSALLLCYGWVLWTVEGKEWWGFWLIGWLCLMYGPILFLGTAYRAFQMFRDEHRWRKFRKLGVDPRADGMARDEEIARKNSLS